MDENATAVSRPNVIATPSPPSLPSSSAEPATTTTTTEGQARSKQRNKVLYIRVSIDEKEQIIAKARTTSLSISRYLARLALDNRPPPTQEDRRRLEFLLFCFKRTESSIRRLQAEASQMRLFAVVPGIKDDFDAALETTRGLIRELEKRL